jgi:hypothetical protein
VGVVFTVLIVFSGQASDSVSVEDERVNKLLAEIDRAGGERRMELVRDVVELLREKAARLSAGIDAGYEKPAELEDAIVRWFETRMQLADVIGRRRSQPLIGRISLSIESERQRKTLLGWMGESLQEAEAIGADLRSMISRAENNPSRRVNLVPELERLGRRLNWQKIFSSYWFARATSPGPEQKRRLHMTIVDVEQFLLGPVGGVQKFELELLKASCLREMERYDEAIKILSGLLQSGQEGGFRNRVLFEMALARIDHAFSSRNRVPDAVFRKLFEAAAGAVENYEALSSRDDPVPSIDVRAMVLGERFCRNWKNAVDGEAECVQNKLDKMIVQFLDRYPSAGIRRPVVDLFFKNWSGVNENNLMASVLVLLATHYFLRAEEQLSGRPGSDLEPVESELLSGGLERAVSLGQEAMDRETHRKNIVVPEALWLIGSAHMKLGNNLDASEAYKTLSRDYPSHPYAEGAALRRVKIYRNMLKEIADSEAEAAYDIRVGLVDAWSVLLDNWGHKNEGDRWRMAMAGECVNLAEDAGSDEQYKRWIRKAIDNYDVVKGNEGQASLMAGFLSLQQQYRLYRRIPPSNTAKTADLVERIESFGSALADRADVASSESDESKLMDWASRCELYSLILQHSVLGDEQAETLLSGMYERWPNCTAARKADRYLFMQALEALQFQTASQLMSRYEERYGDDAVSVLVQMFLQDFYNLVQAEGLESLAEGVGTLYSRWSGWLYERSEKYPRFSYAAAMFHADALVRKKEEVAAGRALRIYEQLSFTDAEQTGSGNSDAVDVGLTIGRARCLRTLDRLEEAIRILTPLCSGLSSDSAEFWTAQIERAECIAMSDDSEDLELLLVLIRQLRALDPDMGRPYVQKRFERLEARIRATLEGA